MARFVTGGAGGKGRKDEVELASDADFAANYPAIWEYLTLDVYDDGKHRDRSTIQMLYEDGRWKGCLNDRAASRSVWVTGESVDGVLRSLEEALASGGPPWRYYEPWGKKAKKGR